MNKQPQLATERTSRPPACAPVALNRRGITIRAVRPDDKERMLQAFRALEPESIYKRFFFAKKALSNDELRRLTECDGVHHVVLVATVARGHQEIIVGLGRYVREGAGAEIAFTVEEDYHGCGIASELLRQLVDIARRDGIAWFEAQVFADNLPMLKVFRRSGLPMQVGHAGSIVQLTLSLGERRGVPDGPERGLHCDRTATFP